MNTTYTIVFIGSGPVNLLKAYLLLKKNPELSISFIDDQPKIGGAWYSDITDKGYEIESGCHIWSYCPEVYSFIENELELDLVPMMPQPVFVYNSWFKIPYSTKGIIDSYKFILTNLLKFKFSQLKSFKSHPHIKTTLFKRHNRYPKKGSPELINTLLNKIKCFPNVDFYLNTSVIKVKVLPDLIELETSTEKLICQQVNLTSVSKIKTVESNQKKIHVSNTTRRYIHLLVQLPHKANKKIGYIRLMKDAVIHRITDVSYQTSYHEQLLLLGILESAYDSMSTEKVHRYIENYLVKVGITKTGIKINFLKNYIFPTLYIEENIRKEINELDARIVLNHSTDLMYGMYHLLKSEKVI